MNATTSSDSTWLNSTMMSGEMTNASSDEMSTMKPSPAASPVRTIPPINFQVYVYLALSLVGIIFNILSLKVLKQFPNSSFYFYLRCLSFADLSFSVMILLGCIKNTATVLMKYYWFAFIFAYIQPWLLQSSAGISIHITVWMTIERFIVIQFPLKARNWLSTRLSRVAMGMIFVFSLGFQMRYFWYTTLVQRYYPDYGNVYFTSRSPLFFGDDIKRVILAGTSIYEYVSSLILIGGNLAIIVSITAAAKKRKLMRGGGGSQEAQSDFNFNKELRMTIVLLSIVVLFLCLEFPAAFPFIISNVSYQTRVTLTITYIVNHVINFFTYLFSNSEFRKKVFELFKGGEKTSGGKATQLTSLKRSAGSHGSGRMRAAAESVRSKEGAAKLAEAAGSEEKTPAPKEEAPQEKEEALV